MPPATTQCQEHPIFLREGGWGEKRGRTIARASPLALSASPGRDQRLSQFARLKGECEPVLALHLVSFFRGRAKLGRNKYNCLSIFFDVFAHAPCSSRSLPRVFLCASTPGGTWGPGRCRPRVRRHAARSLELTKRTHGGAKSKLQILWK